MSEETNSRPEYPAAPSLLEAALTYARAGWHVFPVWWPTFAADGACACGADCKSCGKHPVYKGWRDDATTDATTITNWWSAFPNANVGIALEQSDLCALDVDHPDGPDAAKVKLAWLEAKLGKLPETLVQRSGSGNYHYLFQNPGPDWPFRNELETPLGSLTTRNRHFIVAAPSLHKSGGRYAWQNAIAPAALPDAWLAALLPEQKTLGAVGVPPVEQEPEWLQAIADDERVRLMRAHVQREAPHVMHVSSNTHTKKIAATAAKGYAVRDGEAVLEAMREFNARCEPPFPDGYIVDAVSRFAYRESTRVWGSQLEYLRERTRLTRESFDRLMAVLHASRAAKLAAPPSEAERKLDAALTLAVKLGASPSEIAKIEAAKLKRPRPKRQLTAEERAKEIAEMRALADSLSGAR